MPFCFGMAFMILYDFTKSVPLIYNKSKQKKPAFFEISQ